MSNPQSIKGVHTLNPHDAEHLFHGGIADEYHLLKKICPPATEISRRVGDTLKRWNGPKATQALKVIEIGPGTGITTTFLLASREDILITGIDNAPAMLKQAKATLSEEIATGRVTFEETDALSYLKACPASSIDVVASAYAIHNFLDGYRDRVLEEIYRVLIPGGLFVNGDRYTIDNPSEQLLSTQQEVRHWFTVFREINRPDLLEDWLIHLLSDESIEHIMPLEKALSKINVIGFQQIEVPFREGVNALVMGVKPCQ